MKIKFYANACCEFISQKTRLLTDPWLIDGAFEGSWHHFPPLQTRPEDLRGVDGIYISHLHPDHYDPKTLAHLPREIPVIILDLERNFLEKILLRDGFTNIIKGRSGEAFAFRDMQLTLFKPFTGHVFHDSKLGNLIDTALMVEADGIRALNTNDNTPDLETCNHLKEKYSKFDLIQLNYNAAGPYPSCYENFSREEKISEANRIIERNLKHMIDCCRILEPNWLMPFAGAYVLGGKLWEKNAYLGTTTWDYAKEYASKHFPQQKVLVMREGQEFDLRSGDYTNFEYVPVDMGEMENYIRKEISQLRFPYEDDEQDGLAEILFESLPMARENLWRKQAQFHTSFPLNVGIRVFDRWFTFPFDHPKVNFQEDSFLSEPYLKIEMDERLLKRILLKQAHWNNCEIGAHMSFIRVPNNYLPDFHTMMSFFHLP